MTRDSPTVLPWVAGDARRVVYIPAIRLLMFVRESCRASSSRECQECAGGALSLGYSPPWLRTFLTLLIGEVHDTQTVPSRTQPGVGYSVKPIPEINTGGERWMLNPYENRSDSHFPEGFLIGFLTCILSSGREYSCSGRSPP